MSLDINACKPLLTAHSAYFTGRITSKNAAAARVSTFALPTPPTLLGVNDYTFLCNLAKVGLLFPITCLEIPTSSYSTKGSKSTLFKTMSS